MSNSVISHINPKIKFHETAQKLIRSKIESFFYSMNIASYDPYDEIDAINPTQLKDVSAEYFYYEVFIHLKEDNKGNPVVGYTVFHDASIENELDQHMGLSYTSIDLNDHPVFFFFYIDLQEIIDEVRFQYPSNYLTKSLPNYPYSIDYNKKSRG